MKLPFLPVALLVAAAGSQAQISVATLDSRGAETLVDSLFETGPVPSGDFLDTRFRLRNTGPATVTLTVLRVAGVAFTVLGQPTLPHLVAPGVNVDFRVRFQPAAFGSYSATLHVNDRVVLLRGTSPAGATVLGEMDGRLLTLTAGPAIVMGQVETGRSLTKRFQLRNDTPSPVGVNLLAITGEGFHLDPAPQAPLRLQPAASMDFQVRFSPLRPGIFRGTLTVDDRQFPLEGVALMPPFPDAVLSLEPALTSGKQSKLSIRLSAPAPAAATATLRMEFSPSVALGGNDAAIALLQGSARSTQIAIRQGDTNLPDVMFQTGTTAGQFIFRLELGAQSWQTSAVLAPGVTVLDTVRGSRTATGVVVEVAGFDNSRTASALNFRFFDSKGNALPGDPIRADATADFQRYFRDTAAGGLFLLRAAFPVAGDASLVGAVEVEMENGSGKARSSRATF
jgi:hypothetical protein